MKVEDVTRIRFTSGWTLQDQGNLTISNRLLGKVIIYDERVHAIVHEELTHRCTGEWCDVLVGRIVASRGTHDDRVFHRSGLLEDSNGASNV